MKLLNNLSWIFFANVFVSFSKWIMIIIIAKVLTPTEVGIYSLAFAIGAPITLFANMKLRSLYIASSEEKFKDYMFVRDIFSLLALIVLLLVGYFIYPVNFLIIVLVGLSKILDLQSDLYYSLPHKKNNLVVVGKIMISKQLILTIAFGLVLFLTKNLIVTMVIQIVIQAFFLYFIERRYVFKNYEIITTSISLSSFKKIVFSGLPLGLVQMLTSINTNYPRYILEYKENAEVLGYFSAILYIAIVANLFTNSISQVFLPILSSLFKKENFKALKTYIYQYLTLISTLIGIVFIAFSIIAGEQFLTLMYGEEYARYNNILIIVSISSSINLVNANLDTALMSMRYIKILPKITIFNFFITIFVGYVLIVNYSIIGAALTLVVSALIQLILKFFYVNKKLNSYLF